MQDIIAEFFPDAMPSTRSSTDATPLSGSIPAAEFTNTISGTAAGEFLPGTSSNDSILGGGGDDTMVGRAGNDTLSGGAGTDSVVYYLETGTDGVTVNLQTGTAIDTWGDIDTLISIERVVGSSSGDTIIGSNTAGEWLFGQEGNDIINGGGGDDKIVGGAGRDTLQGGAGVDQLIYYLEGGTGGVSVNLQTGVAVDTFGTTDVISGFEYIYASNSNDTIIGADQGANFLFGRDGNDLIMGGNGTATDNMVGDAGNDTIVGGSEFDQVAYLLESGGRGVLVDLAQGTARDTWGDTDTLRNIEYVVGSNFADTIYGSGAESERLFGEGGNDYIDGRDGNNLIFTGDGNDTIVVGTTALDARDTVVIDGIGNKTIIGTAAAGSAYDHHIVFELDEAVTVNLATGIATSASMRTDFSAANFFLELDGTMHDDVLLGGNPLHDYLEWFCGNQGNDTINGGSGINDTVIYDSEVEIGSYNFRLGRQEYGTHGCVVNLATGVATDTFGYTDRLISIDSVRATRYVDVLTGDAADNAFWGLAGNDTINGGAGSDRVHYGEDYLTGGTAGVTVNLQTGVAIDGFGNRDTLISIEEVYATEYGDSVLGNAADNRIFGYGGNDTLSGATGNDVLLGGDGNDALSGGGNDDELWGGGGNDTLDGGSGIDIARYYDDTAGIIANMSTGTVRDGSGNTDRLISIEWLHGSFFADVITGDAQANQLMGYDGADTINGGAGNDTIVAGGGNDYILGGDGNDELWGNEGADTLAGGAGIDIARYLDDTSGIIANLETGVVRDGFGNTDSLAGIEWLHGSRFSDSILGDAQANQLQGYEGNDTINGGAGSDTIVAGAGNDYILGGDGNDELWGNEGADTLAGGTGIDIARYLDDTSGIVANLATGAVVDGFGNTDSLIGIEWLHGSHFADAITGDAQANQLQGYEGNDTINGGGGNDTLFGGTGNDVLRGGDGNDDLWGEEGNDTLDGGAGIDTLRYITALQAVVASLGAGSATDGVGGSDSFSNIENLTGSQFDDWLSGDDGANLLTAYAGADSLTGGLGNDTLWGGAGGDHYLFLAGDAFDYINELGGGDGTDRVTFQDYLAEQATIYQQNGTTNIVFDFGYLATGEVERLVLVNSANAASDSAIEEIEWADGTIWSLSNLIAHFGQIGVSVSRSATDQDDLLSGSSGADTIVGLLGNDLLEGRAGNDLLSGGDGDDIVRGGDGTDTINGGSGNDTLIGGDSRLDQRDVISGGDGNDSIDGGSGNDELRGDAGNDTIEGGDGSDTLIGGDGADTISGSGWSDLLFGGNGDDFINGGFGFDRINGGAGADRFYHLGVAGHGTDWIQDYSGVENDALVFGITSATRAQFQVNWATTSGAGDDTVREAFVIYRETGQIIWALVDGAANDHIWLQIGGTTYDLLA